MKYIAKALIGCILAAPVLAGTNCALAQGNYPDKAIRLVVPYPPGGTVGILGRIIAARLGQALGQSVIVDNQGGANGNIGSREVAKAKPDGYTLLMGSIGPLVINPNFYKHMPFDATKDFAPISLVAKVPLVVVTGPSHQFPAFQGLVDYAKKNPGKLTFASAGIGSMQHVAGELMSKACRVNIRHIPYKGAGPALVDLLGGVVDMMIDLAPSSVPYIHSGKLHALAVTTTHRLPALAQIPTLHELGFDEFDDVTSWMGVLAPAGTPQPIVRKLNETIGRILQSSDTKKLFAVQGITPESSTPGEFSAYIKTQSAKWSSILGPAHTSSGASAGKNTAR